MTSPSRPRGAASTLPGAPLVALLVIALATRPQLAAIGPMADSIIADLGVTHAFVGLLTTIPVLCMGAFALFGPSLAHVVGVRAGIALSVGVLVLFAVLRAVVPGAVPVLLLTFGVGVGTGVVGPILPMFVRGRLPAHMVAGTAAYAAGTIMGAGFGSGIAVPLETLTGSWHGSLLVLALLSAVAVGAFMVLARRMTPGRPVAPGAAGAPATDAGPTDDAAVERPRVDRPRLPLRRVVAWAIGLLFGLQSWLYYGTTAWLANVYVERGWDPAAAAGLLALMSVASLGAIAGVPVLSHRGASRRSLLVVATSLGLAGLLGITLLPAPAVAWTALIGLGLGGTFTLVLTLPTDISDDAREVGGAAALMLLVGYLIASFGPLALGAVRDATGDFEASLWALVGVAAVMVPLAWSLSPRRLRPPVRDDGHRGPVGPAADLPPAV
jgi:CP family cyanate transporter-like MFS transporter